MELKDIAPTATATFRVIGPGDKEEVLGFTVRYIGRHMYQDYVPSPGRAIKKEGADPEEEAPPVRISTVVTGALVDAVEEWTGITAGGKPLPCTEANRKKVLPHLLGMRVADADIHDPFQALLGWRLIFFASQTENFLKN